MASRRTRRTSPSRSPIFPQPLDQRRTSSPSAADSGASRGASSDGAKPRPPGTQAIASSRDQREPRGGGGPARHGRRGWQRTACRNTATRPRPVHVVPAQRPLAADRFIVAPGGLADKPDGGLRPGSRAQARDGTDVESETSGAGISSPEVADPEQEEGRLRMQHSSSRGRADPEGADGVKDTDQRDGDPGNFIIECSRRQCDIAAADQAARSRPDRCKRSGGRRQ